METKDPKSTESAGADAGAESKDAKADATSDDTLKDLEESEGISDADEGATSEDGKSPTAPSPDGAFDDRGERSDDAGPM